METNKQQKNRTLRGREEGNAGERFNFLLLYAPDLGILHPCPGLVLEFPSFLLPSTI